MQFIAIYCSCNVNKKGMYVAVHSSKMYEYGAK